MESLYIVGASGAAKEIFLLVKQINAVRNTYNFKGFIDVNSHQDSLQIGSEFYPVLNEIEFLETSIKANIVFGIGDESLLEKIIKKYTSKPHLKFPNLIHPNTTIDDSIQLGQGNIICESSILTINITIGSFNYINRGVHIGHDTHIDSYNIINPCSIISGGVSIKSNNLIGTHSTLLQYISIGSENKIGAGAVVTKSVGNANTMIGIPAKSVNND